MTEQKQIYRITSNDPQEINRILARLSDRLDKLEGLRGTPVFESDVDLQGNRIVNAANAVEDTDVVVKGQLTGGTVDHGELSGLTDDDHSQYAKLTGRSGGQTMRGGTAAGDDLILQSTTNITRGEIQCRDSLVIYDENSQIIHGFLKE